MCIKIIFSTGFLLLIISGAAVTSGCMDTAQDITGDNTQTSVGDKLDIPDTEEELAFMKDMLNEMKSQGKDISSPLETYRIARMQAKNSDYDGFGHSLSLFYQQCNTIMVNEHEIQVIQNEIEL